MMDYNTELFRQTRYPHTRHLVPDLSLRYSAKITDSTASRAPHHSEYIQRLITAGKLKLHPGTEVFTCHHPCELGRGSGIYEAPREVIGAIRRIARSSRKPRACPLLRL